MKKLPDPIKPTRNPNLCDTRQQARLLAAANRILRKSGYFTKSALEKQEAVEADAIGTHGLRPTWHSKA